MKLIPGKLYVWQEKRLFVFREKIGREYYFSCPDYASPGDPGTVTLKSHQLKDLKPQL